MAVVLDLRSAYDGLYVLQVWFAGCHCGSYLFLILLFLMPVSDDVYAFLADVGGGSGTYSLIALVNPCVLTFNEQWQTEPNQY